MKDIIFNPIWSNHKSIVGAVPSNDKFKLTVKVIYSINLFSMRLVIKDDKNNIIRVTDVEYGFKDYEYQVYQVWVDELPSGLYWYCFEFTDVYGKHYISSNHSLDAVIVDYLPLYWQLLVFDPFIGNLDWIKGKVIYQIMVDRFYKGANNPVKPYVYMHKIWDEVPFYLPFNGSYAIDFYGGDLLGIIEKLDYLKKLNVGAIYLNPIFEAKSNHKYDTADYLKIDSMFGTDEDFKSLCLNATNNGMRIILDGVFNHTGDNSIYFNKYNEYDVVGAFQSKDSKYYPWFKFYNHPHGYESWWGFTTLPALNQKNKEYVDFITGENGVLKKWLNLGASGYRLDVVDELNNDFLNKISKTIKDDNNENIVIGEVWEDASNKTAYSERRSYLNGHQLDSVMNYPFRIAIIDYLKYNKTQNLKDTIRRIINNYPKHVLDCLMNVLSTHDTVRLISAFSSANYEQMNNEQLSLYTMKDNEYKVAILKEKMAVTIQFMLPGIPSIFYGDEAGLQGFKDPFCRRTYPWQKENQTLLSYYIKLSQIRKDPIFIDGIYEEVYLDDQSHIPQSTKDLVFAFARQKDNQRIITIVNNSYNPFSYNIEKGLDLLKNVVFYHHIEVKAQSSVIFKLLID